MIFLKVSERLMLTLMLVDKESHIESRAKTGLRAIVTFLLCGSESTQN